MKDGERLLCDSRFETSLMDAVGPELLTRLLDEHGGALVLYAQQWCDTPEDVVQEALLRLVRQAAAPENVVGWVYRVVRNGAISASRSARRREHREAAAAQRGEPWFNPSQAERLDADTATAALKRLSIEQREVIVARVWGELTFEQITGVPQAMASRMGRPNPSYRLGKRNTRAAVSSAGRSPRGTYQVKWTCCSRPSCCVCANNGS